MHSYAADGFDRLVAHEHDGAETAASQRPDVGVKPVRIAEGANHQDAAGRLPRPRAAESVGHPADDGIDGAHADDGDPAASVITQ